MLISKKIDIPEAVFHLICAWLGAAAFEYIMLPAGEHSLADLAGISKMSGLRVAVLTAAGFILQSVLPRSNNSKIKKWRLVLIFSTYAIASAICAFSWPFVILCVLIALYMCIYAWFGWNGGTIPIQKTAREKIGLYQCITIVFAALFLLFNCAWTVARVHSFSTPTFDVGIFSQMFYYLKTTGQPFTTLERDGFLSHFAVHVSPIYYLMLPIYYIFPYVETLQITQAFVLTSAVLPLWNLGKLYGLQPKYRMLICILLLLFPAFSGGTSYDLHENCFLTPLLLWLLFGIDSGKAFIVFTTAVLACFVKEDAAVYVGIIAFYFVVRSVLHKDKRRLGISSIVLLFSIVWFSLVTAYLSIAGEGVMSYRYSNFMYGGSESLLTVIKVVLMCPMKVLYECVDYEKLKFIGLTLIPIVGLPLITRRYERLILLIPYILVNLMSDYKYQHDIMFQYTFGSTACLFYLLTVNLAEIKRRDQRKAVMLLALCISSTCFYTINMQTAMKYMNNCRQYSEYYSGQRALLNIIPEDASVAATTFYTTYLFQRKEIYDIRYGSDIHIFGCEYIVIKVSEVSSYKRFAKEGTIDGIDAFRQRLQNYGYKCISQIDGVIEIYKKE